MTPYQAAAAGLMGLLAAFVFWSAHRGRRRW